MTSSEKVLADLKKGKINSCYLLFGDEEYLLNETLHKITDLIIKPADRDFGLFNLDGENTDIENIIEYILTPSLLCTNKVVIIRNTTLFHSNDNLSDLIQKIRKNIDENSSKAVKNFQIFLKLTGFSLEDLQQNGWRRISNEQWNDVSGDSGEDREKWLPRILDICSSLNVKEITGKDNTEKLEEVFKNGIPSGNCLILTSETVDKRKKIFKIIAQHGVVLPFTRARKEIEQKDVQQNEIQKLLDQYKKKMTPAAWSSLRKKTGFELRKSIMEVEKLISFTGSNSMIEDVDVAEVVGKTKEDSIFDLTAALGEKNQQDSLLALKALLSQGLHHLMILSMIVREIRFLLQAKILFISGKLPKINGNMDYSRFQKNVYPVLKEIAAQKDMPKDFLVNKHPFVIFNALRNSGHFSYPMLVRYLEDLLEIDRKFKSSAGNPQFLLESFLIKACAKAS